MAQMTWLTKGGLPPQGLQRIYIACHPAEVEEFIQPVADDLVLSANCSVWYDADLLADHRDQETLLDLTQMNAFVFPVSKRLLCEANRARDVDLQIALDKHIPILPIMMETNLDDEFARVFGDLHYLDRQNDDETATPYAERLQQRLAEVLTGTDLAERVRNAFVARAFLSYRKKDRVHAQRLMRLLHDTERGRQIAIWYDEFLTPGEDFSEAIATSLTEADLFLLAVTPNLLEDPNYVKDIEYPLALQQGKHIVAARMVDTDETELRTYYQDLPDIATSTERTRSNLTARTATDDSSINYEPDIISRRNPTLEEIVNAALDTLGTPRRTLTSVEEYLIGVAYMNGIDVEVDRDRGIELILHAASAGFAEAMSYLGVVCWSGNGVARDWSRSIEWCEKAVDAYETTYRSIPDKGEDKERAAVELKRELIALMTRFRFMGKVSAALRTSERLLALGNEWKSWSDSYEAFAASYFALTESTVLFIELLHLEQAQEACERAYELLIERRAILNEEKASELILGNLMQSSSIAMLNMDFDLAHTASQEALKLAESFADANYTAQNISRVMSICVLLGTIDLLRCRPNDAIAQAERAIKIADEMTIMDALNEELKLMPQGLLTEALRACGKEAEALKSSNAGLTVAANVRSYTDPSTAWLAPFNLYTGKGSTLFELHQWTECDAIGREMLDLGEALEGMENKTLSLFLFMGYFYRCYAALNQGELGRTQAFADHMASHLPTGWEQAEDTDTLRFGARLLECRGLIERAQGNNDAAQQYFDRMYSLSKQQLSKLGLFQAGLDHGYACLQLSETAFDQENVAEALRFANESCDIFNELISAGRVAANTRYYCDALRLQGRAALLQRRITDAFQPLRKAVELGEDLLAWDESEDSRTIVGACYQQLYEYYRALDDDEQALKWLATATKFRNETYLRTNTLRAYTDLLESCKANIETLPSNSEQLARIRLFVESAETWLQENHPDIKNFHALF